MRVGIVRKFISAARGRAEIAGLRNQPDDTIRLFGRSRMDRRGFSPRETDRESNARGRRSGKAREAMDDTETLWQAPVAGVMPELIEAVKRRRRRT